MKQFFEPELNFLQDASQDGLDICGLCKGLNGSLSKIWEKGSCVSQLGHFWGKVIELSIEKFDVFCDFGVEKEQGGFAILVKVLFFIPIYNFGLKLFPFFFLLCILSDDLHFFFPTSDHTDNFSYKKRIFPERTDSG